MKDKSFYGTTDLPFLPFSDEEEVSIEGSRVELHNRLRDHTYATPMLTGGDIDAQWEMAESTGDETVGGSNSTPDQNVVQDMAEAMGIHYDDAEELRCGEKEHLRDIHRWELDPASAEDYRQRTRRSY